MKYFVMALLCVLLGCGEQKKEKVFIGCGSEQAAVGKRCSPLMSPGNRSASEVCSKASQCFEIDLEECQSTVYEQQGLSQFVQVDAENLAVVDDELSEASLEVDYKNLNTCLTEIRNLSCSQFNQENYISAGALHDYTNALKIFAIHDGCKNMFQKISEGNL
jgi:hypothetical protein